MFDGLVRKVLGHQVQLTIAETQPIEDHGRRCGSHTHLFTIGRVLLIQLGGYTYSLIDSRYNPQVIRPFIDVALAVRISRFLVLWSVYLIFPS